MTKPKTGMGKPCIAAKFIFGGFFKHNHMFGARLAGRDSRFKRGTAPADDDDVTGLIFAQNMPPRFLLFE
jgi:hypothetical protein